MNSASANTDKHRMSAPRSPLGGEPEVRLRSVDFPWRVLSLLNGFRILVVVLLLALFYLVTGPRAVGDSAPLVFLVGAFLYLILAVGSVYLIAQRSPTPTVQAYLQVLGDITAITTFVYASGGISSGLGNLLVVPIGAASLLVHRRQAGVLPAAAAIALLAENAIASLQAPGTANSMSTGLLGATLFVIALAAQPLATRLRESEDLARRRGVDLANMAELNDYVIQHLRESLVVIDPQDQIRLINGAAMQSLDVNGPAVGRRLADISPRLQTVIDAWRKDPSQLRAQPPMLMRPDGAAMLLPQIAELGRDRPSALLIFLEDQSLIAERAQQSKLAALGRLSASIAHEIRNPVGAMSHAAQLLAESPAVAGAGDQRLTDIIHQNAMRISSIVDNVLQLSRPRHELAEVQRFDLSDWVDGFVAEYLASHQLAPPAIAATHEARDVAVRMDPSHLHQVVWNLCDNALKYGAPNDHGIAIALRTGRASTSQRPYLEVADFGPGVETSAVERMFEPFFTSHHVGTGLGLFIARQLCEGSGGTLAYTPRDQFGAVFRITFADPDRWLREGRDGRE